MKALAGLFANPLGSLLSEDRVSDVLAFRDQLDRTWTGMPDLQKWRTMRVWQGAELDPWEFSAADASERRFVGELVRGCWKDSTPASRDEFNVRACYDLVAQIYLFSSSSSSSEEKAPSPRRRHLFRSDPTLDDPLCDGLNRCAFEGPDLRLADIKATRKRLRRVERKAAMRTFGLRVGEDGGAREEILDEEVGGMGCAGHRGGGEEEEGALAEGQGEFLAERRV